MYRFSDELRNAIVVFDTLMRLGFDEDTTGIVVEGNLAIQILHNGAPHLIALPGAATKEESCRAMGVWNQLSQRERQEECDQFMPIQRLLLLVETLRANGVKIPTSPN